ncbi:MAG TPA: hypothetical protein VGH91_11055 [Gammaproteobacteria bacterium]|jgi:hypothetical protein
MKSFLVFAAMLALTACAAPSATPEFAFTAGNQGMGLLVGSLSTDDPGNYFSQDVNVFFAPEKGSKGPDASVTLNDHCKASGMEGLPDFKQPCGRLFALVMSPGNYQLNYWNIVDAGGGVVEPGNWNPAKFTIQAGKVTYVGNIHMVFDPTLPGGGPADWRGWPKASDMHERDIAFLLKKYPHLQQGDVTLGVLALDPPSGLCNSGNLGTITLTFCGK